MKIEDVLDKEAPKAGLMLVRDRLFWQAWEYSAFLFVNHLRPYRIHRRIVKKVGEEVVWLGFPNNTLESIIADALKLGAHVASKTEDCVVLMGLPKLAGFETWKLGAGAPPIQAIAPEVSPKMETLLPIYRKLYDLSLHVLRACGKVSRNYRYNLGAQASH
jgi:hypothetical protein